MAFVKTGLSSLCPLDRLGGLLVMSVGSRTAAVDISLNFKFVDGTSKVGEDIAEGQMILALTHSFTRRPAAEAFCRQFAAYDVNLCHDPL